MMSKYLRICSIIILLCCLRVVAFSQILALSESVRFNENDRQEEKKTQSISLSKALSELERQFDISIFYKSELIENLTVENFRKYKSVHEALEKILKPHGLNYKKGDKDFFVIIKENKTSEKRLDKIEGKSIQSETLWAEAEEDEQYIAPSSSEKIPPMFFKREFKISGKVTAIETAEVLPGVSIVEKGTTNGTITDSKGEYSLTVSNPNAFLVFSYVGYLSEEVQVNSRAVIDIQLTMDIKKLNEVVVVGYGTQKRGDVTGAISSISEDKIKGVVATSLDQALQGRVAGVEVVQNSGQPGGGVSVRVRGINSINGSNEPLYVIDGVPISGDASGTAVGFDWAGGGNGQTAVSALAGINPSDIASIDVLKDASATAIYGSRGSNGVVIITTKRGKAGESKVSYESYYGFQQPSKYMDVMNLREYASYNNELAEGGWVTRREEFRDPTLLGEGTDWQREVFRNAGIMNQQLTISGGKEKTQYAVSANYFKQQGIVIGSQFDRYSIRLNLDNQTKSWLKVGNSFMVSKTNERITLNDSDDGVIANTLTQNPSVPLRTADGKWGGPAQNQGGITNPVAMALDRDLRLMRMRLNGNVYAELAFLKNFTLRSEIGGDFQFNNNYAFQPTYEYGPQVYNKQNQSRRQFANSQFWMVKNYLTYHKNFTGVHDLTVMIGQEAQESVFEGLMGGRKNFPSNDIRELNAGEASANVPAINSGYKGSNALTSYFGRFNYSLNDKYLLTATVRADASSNFGPNNKWGYFPSAAAAWKLSNEDFMENVPGVTNLKLRLGWGLVGNQAIPAYAYGSALVARASGIGQGFLIIRTPNADVKWEASRTANLGLDLGLFNNRLEITVDAYDKQVNDMLLKLPLPNYMGGGSWMGIEEPYVNLGKMQNKGLEISIRSTNIQEDDFRWSTDLIFSRNVNKLLSLGVEGSALYSNVQWFHTVTKTQVGHPVGQFFGYETDGVYQDYDDIINSPKQNSKIDPWNGVWPGDLKFKNLDEKTTTPTRYTPEDQIDQTIDDNDRKFIGNPNPDFSFGLNNSVTYKGFDLTLYIQGVYGNEIYNFTRRQTEGMRDQYANQLKTVNERAKLELIDPTGSASDAKNIRVSNPETNLPRAIPSDPNNNLRVSDRFVEDGSYLRVKNIAFGYTLPPNLISKIGLTRIRIYTNIQNLATITNYSGYDPEVGAYNQNPLLQGVDNGRYPLPRMYTFGLTAEF